MSFASRDISLSLTFPSQVWTVEGGRVCRGIIATPARVQPFQVTFDDAAPPEVTTPHSAEVCGTNYASNEEAEQASNPITGMVIHPPNLSESTPTPHFSLVRLSATVLNHDWYQTNLPIASDSNDPSSKPKWVTEMTQFMEEKQPIALAYRPVNPDGKLPKGDNDEDAAGDEEEYDDDSDDEDEDEDEDGSDWGSVEDFSKTEYLGELDRLAEMEKVSMTRLRTWGMTSSPGGGTHAVFVTLNSTIKPERHTFGGMRCRVLFGPNIAPRDDNILAMKSDLSTEGRMWEWMYGGGPPVPGASDLLSVNHTARTSAREKFKEFAAAQTCVFCEGVLILEGQTSRCNNGHSFGKHPYFLSRTGMHRYEIVPAARTDITDKLFFSFPDRELRFYRHPYYNSWQHPHMQRMWAEMPEAPASKSIGTRQRPTRSHRERSLGRAVWWLQWEVYELSERTSSIQCQMRPISSLW